MQRNKIKSQVKDYLESNYDGKYEIYSVLYDNMSSFKFEYANKIRVKDTKTEFLVYFDDKTNQVTGTYIKEKWAEDLDENETIVFDDPIRLKTLNMPLEVIETI